MDRSSESTTTTVQVGDESCPETCATTTHSPEEMTFHATEPVPSPLHVDEAKDEKSHKTATRKKSNELARLLLFTDTSLWNSGQNDELQNTTSTIDEDAQESDKLKDIVRSKWEYAASMQFLQLFGEDLNVSEFYSEDVEDAFVSTNESTLLIELHIKLMKGLVTHAFAPHEWQLTLGRVLQKYLDIEEEAIGVLDPSEGDDDPDEDGALKKHSRRASSSIESKKHSRTSWTNPMSSEHAVYWSLSAEDKVMILYKLCEWQLLDIERFRSRIKDVEAREGDWRVEPLGYDAKHNVVWLFDDNRLYKESKASSKRKGSEPKWELVCLSIEDWQTLAARLSHSRNSNEKALHKTLEEHVFPIILPQLQDKMKQMKKRELQEAFSIKRSTRLQSRLAAQKEVEGALLLFDADPSLSSEKQSYMKEQLERDRRTKERDDRLRLREERLRVQEEERLLRDIELAREREERLAQRERRKLGISSPEASGTESDQTSVRKSPKKRKLKMQDEHRASWHFECPCGSKGTNYDDGTDMIQCTECLVWQHMACDKRLARWLADSQNRCQQESELQTARRRGRKPKKLEDIHFLCRKCHRQRKRRDKDLRRTISRLKTELEQMKQGLLEGSYPLRDHESGDVSPIEDSQENVDIETSYDEPSFRESQRPHFAFKPIFDLERPSYSDPSNIILSDSHRFTSNDMSSDQATTVKRESLSMMERQPTTFLLSRQQSSSAMISTGPTTHQDPSFSLDLLSAIALQGHEESSSMATTRASSTPRIAPN